MTGLSAGTPYLEALKPDVQGIACCFDDESNRMLKDFRKKGLGETAKAIHSVLKTREITGMKVLELGSGVGGLTLQLLKDGAASAAGIDLSPKMVSIARTLAAEEGLSSSASFEVGDATTTRLDAADLVILDRVVCCYPDFVTLVEISSSAANRYYALSMPNDDRKATQFARLLLPLQRIFSRHGSFRFFIHPRKAVVAQLQKKGFVLVSEAKAGWIWCAMVFAAPTRA
jgi:SAM-dependent methyltransferase